MKGRGRSVSKLPWRLYAYPHVYDAAFSWDRTREAETYLEVAESCLGHPPRSAVELACGTGPLIRRWAARGMELWGVDAEPASLERARQLSGGSLPPSHWVQGDLRSFRLPRPVDLAVVPLDSLGYLVETSDLLSFFRSAHRCLAPGGVLALDVTLHPTEGPPLPIHSQWTVELVPDGRLRVRWRSLGRAWGSPPRRWEVGTVDIELPSGRRQRFEDRAPHALFTLDRLQQAAQLPQLFRRCVVYSDAAHRAQGSHLRRLAAGANPTGSRLVLFVKAGPGPVRVAKPQALGKVRAGHGRPGPSRPRRHGPSGQP